ncbi:LTXXQ motif family protein [compost metagenome]
MARTQPDARPARQGPREDWSKLTTPQRLDKMAAMKAERDARMGQRHDAIKSFYAVLNAEQQKVFDAKQMQGFQRAGMKGHGKNHHHGGGHHRMGGTI